MKSKWNKYSLFVCSCLLLVAYALPAQTGFGFGGLELSVGPSLLSQQDFQEENSPVGVYTGNLGYELGAAVRIGELRRIGIILGARFIKDRGNREGLRLESEGLMLFNGQEMPIIAKVQAGDLSINDNWWRFDYLLRIPFLEGKASVLFGGYTARLQRGRQTFTYTETVTHLIDPLTFSYYPLPEPISRDNQQLQFPVAEKYGGLLYGAEYITPHRIFLRLLLDTSFRVRVPELDDFDQKKSRVAITVGYLW